MIDWSECAMCDSKPGFQLPCLLLCVFMISWSLIIPPCYPRKAFQWSFVLLAGYFFFSVVASFFCSSKLFAMLPAGSYHIHFLFFFLLCFGVNCVISRQCSSSPLSFAWLRSSWRFSLLLLSSYAFALLREVFSICLHCILCTFFLVCRWFSRIQSVKLPSTVLTNLAGHFPLHLRPICSTRFLICSFWWSMRSCCGLGCIVPSWKWFLVKDLTTWPEFALQFSC